jgi:hypothetical protein
MMFSAKATAEVFRSLQLHGTFGFVMSDAAYAHEDELVRIRASVPKAVKRRCFYGRLEEGQYLFNVYGAGTC